MGPVRRRGVLLCRSAAVAITFVLLNALPVIASEPGTSPPAPPAATVAPAAPSVSPGPSHGTSGGPVLPIVLFFVAAPLLAGVLIAIRGGPRGGSSNDDRGIAGM